MVKEPNTNYNLYQSNKLDMISLVGEQAQQLAKNKDVVHRPLAATEYLQYKQTSGIFKNKNLRKAFSLAINRNQLINKVMQNGSVVSKALRRQILQPIRRRVRTLPKRLTLTARLIMISKRPKAIIRRL